MPTATTTVRAKIQELQQQIAVLKDTVTKELRERRVALAQELHVLDAELARLTGRPFEERYRTRRPTGRIVTLSELKGLLAAAPGRTLNVRKAGIDPKAVRTLAKANPGELRMGGRGPWPEVTLV
jgi:hypothetical protein